jgi:hypothetical protein
MAKIRLSPGSGIKGITNEADGAQRLHQHSISLLCKCNRVNIIKTALTGGEELHEEERKFRGSEVNKRKYASCANNSNIK